MSIVQGTLAPALALGLATLTIGISAPPVGASPSLCAIENNRNHKYYATLQAAHDAARANDTLSVKGTCVGTTVVTKSLRIIGVTNRAARACPRLMATLSAPSSQSAAR